LSSTSIRGKIEASVIPSVLLDIIRFEEGSVQYPPKCAATAVAILVDLKDGNSRRISELRSKCDAIIRSDQFEEMAGGALLYRSAARATIELIQSELWNPSDLNIFTDCLTTLERVLSSPVFDVRLLAAKTFKKKIYHSIDRLMVDRERALPADNILIAIARVLLKCMEIEVHCGAAKKGSFGFHVPTVRRLSRCFMECFDAYQRLDVSCPAVFVDAVEGEGQELWSSASSMMHREGIMREPAIESNGEAFLSGNAVELMAVRIAADITRGNVCDSRVRSLVQVIHRLNDPHVSWRSRYSAAKAIEISRLLTSTNGWLLRNEILRVVVEMLQDSDSDVRSCAARVARRVEEAADPETSPQYHSSLPVQALRRAYHLAYSVPPSKEQAAAARAADTLLRTVLDNTDDFLPVMQAIDEELESTRNALESSDLINASTARKIFEEEDPNPYNERLLSNQLATQALVRLPKLAEGDSVSESVEKLLNRLTVALSLLDQRLDVGGIVHDLTRFGTIFPPLVGLLSAAAACIYHGIAKDEDLKEIRRLAKIGISSKTFHPVILSLMDCVANAEIGDESTKGAILDSLFLARPETDA
jgi:hypothetical protein